MSFKLFGQFFENPSFEGPNQENSPPPGWWPCSRFSTPDTQPGEVEVTMPPSNGETYVSMRVRGELHDSAPPDFTNTRENVQTLLTKVLRQDVCYVLKADLAYATNAILFGLSVHTEPLLMRVWGGNAYCDTAELLGVSELVDNTEWKTFTMNLVPKESDYMYLYLEPNYAQDEPYHGMLLVDNLQMFESNVVSNVKQKLDTTIFENEPVILSASESCCYRWYPDYGLSCYNCQAPTATVPESETYRVNLSDTNNCYYVEEFRIKVINCDVIRQQQSRTIDVDVTPNQTISLEAGKGITYKWFPEEHLSCISCPFPVLQLEQSASYTCYITDEYGCEFEETFIINVELEIPNVITPNGDGYNDFFEIFGLPENHRLTIFDRYGNIILSTEDYRQDWDGKNADGSELPVDTYWYTLFIKKSGIEKNGYVFLKR